MADDMKLILRELEKVNLRMDDLRDDLKGDINDLRVEMNEMKCEMNEMNGKISVLQDSNARIQLLIENDLSKKIDIIGEGHDFLKMKLDEALQMENKWESMGLEQINLRIDVNKLKHHVGIA